MGVEPKIGVFYPPKSSILIGFAIINHPFWSTPIFGNTQIIYQTYYWTCIFQSCFFTSTGFITIQLQGFWNFCSPKNQRLANLKSKTKLQGVVSPCSRAGHVVESCMRKSTWVKALYFALFFVQEDRHALPHQWGNAKQFWDALKGAAMQHFESSLVIFLGWWEVSHFFWGGVVNEDTPIPPPIRISQEGKESNVATCFRYNIPNMKTQVPQYLAYHSILHVSVFCWQFCECDIFGMVSSRDPFNGCKRDKHNVWGSSQVTAAWITWREIIQKVLRQP